jgi:hypothetical protein
MPFVKGCKRVPGSGRRKGQTTRLTGDAIERLERLGCDPLKIMHDIAVGEKTPLDLKGRMAAELAQYVWPKRRSTDILPAQQPGRVVYGWVDDADAKPIKTDERTDSNNVSKDQVPASPITTPVSSLPN